MACACGGISERSATGLSAKNAVAAVNSGAAVIAATGSSQAARSSMGNGMSAIGLMTRPLCRPSRRISSSLALRRNASAADAPARAATSWARRMPRVASRRDVSTMLMSRPRMVVAAAARRDALSALADPQQHAPGGAAAHHVERLVDLIEREFVGDEAVERQAARPRPAGSGAGYRHAAPHRRRASRSALC